MKNFKLINHFLQPVLLLIIFTNHPSYAKKLTQTEFDHLISKNNQKGIQLHDELAVALISGNHKLISDNLCATYKMSKAQYEIASENSELLKAKRAKENAIENIKNIENIIPKNQKPMEKYCKDSQPN